MEYSFDYRNFSKILNNLNSLYLKSNNSLFYLTHFLLVVSRSNRSATSCVWSNFANPSCCARNMETFWWCTNIFHSGWPFWNRCSGWPAWSGPHRNIEVSHATVGALGIRLSRIFRSWSTCRSSDKCWKSTKGCIREYTEGGLSRRLTCLEFQPLFLFGSRRGSAFGWIRPFPLCPIRNRDDCLNCRPFSSEDSICRSMTSLSCGPCLKKCTEINWEVLKWRDACFEAYLWIYESIL